jgi:hypothetical protein
MFNPSRDQVRQFFFDAWARYREAAPLEGLATQAVEIILLHPEYQALLEKPETAVDRDYTPESGVANPFLHLSLHLAIAEQLGIDQPPGIRGEFERLLAAKGRHDAEHAILDCLGETIWAAQRSGLPPDTISYLECIRRK